MSITHTPKWIFLLPEFDLFGSITFGKPRRAIWCQYHPWIFLACPLTKVYNMMLNVSLCTINICILFWTLWFSELTLTRRRSQTFPRNILFNSYRHLKISSHLQKADLKGEHPLQLGWYHQISDVLIPTNSTRYKNWHTLIWIIPPISYLYTHLYSHVSYAWRHGYEQLEGHKLMCRTFLLTVWDTSFYLWA